jgi:hypothetical protein
MSNRWFYEIDGQVVGPVEQTRLRLLADSGMLQPHHKVRREDQANWSQASAVRGLVTPAAAPAAVPVARSAQPTPAAQEDSPFGKWSPPATDAPAPAGVFDFFGEGDAPAAPPKLVPKPEKPVKPAPPRKVPEPPPRAAVVPTERSPVAPSPPPAPVPPSADADELDIPEGVAEPAEEGANPFAFEPLPAQAANVGSRTGETKLSAPAKPTPVGEASSAEAASPEPPVAPTRTAEPHPASPLPVHAVLEVTGRAVDLLPDHTLRPLDGKTSFRLHRAWLLAVTKLADGATRMAYLRLSSIDAGIVERRYEAGRGQKEPYPVLSFHAGEQTVALIFEGSDKPCRGFIEKVLLHGLSPKLPGPQKG